MDLAGRLPSEQGMGRRSTKTTPWQTTTGGLLMRISWERQRRTPRLHSHSINGGRVMMRHGEAAMLKATEWQMAIHRYATH